MLDRCKIDREDIPFINNKYIINDKNNKLNIIGAFFEKINSPRYLNENTRIKEIADKEVLKIKT